MATFVFCYDCPSELVLKIEEALSCVPHIHIDSRPDPVTYIHGNEPCVVITNYQGVVASLSGNISVPEIVMKVFHSRLTV